MRGAERDPLPARAIEILGCPDCGSPLRSHAAAGSLLALSCGACGVLFPVSDDILVILPRQARNAKLELPLLDRIEGVANALGLDVEEPLRATRALVEAARDSVSWEWQDEAFWAAEYGHTLAVGERKNWNDRLWEREPFVSLMLRETGDLEGRVIADVGVGEAQTFIRLIEPRCTPTTLYVAADISLAALRLSRARNPHLNALYVLCTADRLPLRTGSVDLLCYFGIMHHTERKVGLIGDASSLLRPGGLLLLHESVERPRGSALFGLNVEEQSAHEERLDAGVLQQTLRLTRGVRVLASREYHTALYTVLTRGPLGAVAMRWYPLFKLAEAMDAVAMRLLRRRFPLFRPGMVLVVARKDVPEPVATRAP